MKIRIISLLSLLFLSACSLNKNVITTSIKKHTYDEVKEDFIAYEKMKKQEEYSYFAYIFNEFCSHCHNIKDLIIETALSSKEHFYFIEYTNEIPLNGSEYDLDKMNEENIFYIHGTPSLIHIVDLKLDLILSGEEAIKNYLNVEFLPC